MSLLQTRNIQSKRRASHNRGNCETTQIYIFLHIGTQIRNMQEIITPVSTDRQAGGLSLPGASCAWPWQHPLCNP